MAQINTSKAHLGIFPRSRWGKFVVGGLALLGAVLGGMAGAGERRRSEVNAGDVVQGAVLGAVGFSLGSWIAIKIVESVALDMARVVAAESTVTTGNA